MQTDSNGARVTKRVTRVTQNVTLAVLGKIHAGKYAQEVSRELNMSKRMVHYHIQKLIDTGLVRHDVYSSARFYKLTPDGEITHRRARVTNSSKATTEEIKGVHNLYIKIPILERPESRNQAWDKINTRFKNSIQRHRRCEDIGASIRETSKHICIQLGPKTIENYDQINGICAAAIGFVLGELGPKGYVLDYMNPVVSGLKITHEDEKSRELMKQGLRVNVKLGRMRQKIFKGDPVKPAYVELDKTPGPNWETNDREHARLRALEPEYVREIRNMTMGGMPTMNAIANTQMIMAGVMRELQKETRLIKRMIKSRKDQRGIKEFLGAKP